MAVGCAVVNVGIQLICDTMNIGEYIVTRQETA